MPQAQIQSVQLSKHQSLEEIGRDGRTNRHTTDPMRVPFSPTRGASGAPNNSRSLWPLIASTLARPVLLSESDTSFNIDLDLEDSLSKLYVCKQLRDA
ncbi:hypothetical protein EVAR_61100_1 [Eumeta japonica]|uniref:Uncharacterized protein n=1 Tax=Eumeta variegata TaxID=151549 RepID=A0A4C1YLS5_EUMVA|nr:hypothetical protein EVAR_61100_1 [Eumeta japonica]